VALPEGKNKYDRWKRLAREAAEQSRRQGVMRIEPLTPLAKAIDLSAAAGAAYYGSTAPAALSIRDLARLPHSGTVTLFIGPEGDWSPDEIAAFNRARIAGISLGRTILRIETAALAAAVVWQIMLDGIG
jgi:16S rRNA (uracil1498-N3)-methyltransferase